MRTQQKVAIGVVAAAVAMTTTVASADRDEPWVERTFTMASPADGLFTTHNGGLPLAPFPAGIPRFTEPELRTSFALGAKLRDTGGRLVGFATELENMLPDSDISAGKLHSRTLWTLVLPGIGSITFDQFERADEVAGPVFKHAIETGIPWVGNLSVRTTEGHTGKIVGGTEQFAGIRGSAAEINHIYRFDPRKGELVATIELRLRYRVSSAPTSANGPARGRTVERQFFAATPDDVVFLTHEGTMPIGPSPAGMPRLSEPELRTGFALGAKLRDNNGKLLGFITELEYLLPDSDIGAGRLRNYTLWTAFLPGRGSIIFGERERQDTFVTTVLKPAMETGRPWVGDFTLTTTVPGSGVIVGGTGEFAGITGTGVEVGHIRRFDPAGRVVEGTSEVRLRYRLPC